MTSIYNQTIKMFGSQPEPIFESAEQQKAVWGREWGCDNDVGQIGINGPIPVPVPLMWKHGIASRVTSPGIGSCHWRVSPWPTASRLERIDPWVITAPLGLPVVPDV